MNRTWMYGAMVLMGVAVSGPLVFYSLTGTVNAQADLDPAVVSLCQPDKHTGENCQLRHGQSGLGSNRPDWLGLCGGSAHKAGATKQVTASVSKEEPALLQAASRAVSEQEPIQLEQPAVLDGQQPEAAQTAPVWDELAQELAAEVAVPAQEVVNLCPNDGEVHQGECPYVQEYAPGNDRMPAPCPNDGQFHQGDCPNQGSCPNRNAGYGQGSHEGQGRHQSDHGGYGWDHH